MMQQRNAHVPIVSCSVCWSLATLEPLGATPRAGGDDADTVARNSRMQW